MKNENEKKGLFSRLIGPKKGGGKNSCCCNFEIEEIKEDDKDKATEKNSKEKE